MYYLANYEERHAPPTYKRLNKVHAFYTVRDGCLVRDKYRTAMHQIREMFK